MSFVNVYLRGSEAIVVPTGGRGGVYCDIEPVLVVPPEAEALQRAIVEARDVSARSEVFVRPKKWVVQARLRLKSIKSFYADVGAVRVYDDEKGRLIVARGRPAADGRGFVPDGFDVATTADELGQTTLALLKDAPRFP